MCVLLIATGLAVGWWAATTTDLESADNGTTTRDAL